MVEYAFIIIFEGMIAAAQCMIARGVEAGIQKALSGSAGPKFSRADAYRCAGFGLAAGFHSMVMMGTLAVAQARMAASTSSLLALPLPVACRLIVATGTPA